MRPFQSYLAEQETDYEYKLCSVENIHNHEVMSKIRLALGRYGLIELKPEGVKTQMTKAQSEVFDEYPFSVVYVTKVVLSSPLTSREAVQSVSLFTRVKDDKLAFFDKNDKIVMDGADTLQHAHAVEVEPDFAQSEVGDERAGTLVSDLMKELSQHRENDVITRDVYEGFVVSHKEIGKSLGRNVRRGFYLIEHHTSGSPTLVGPFENCPENYSYSTYSRPMRIVEEYEAGPGLTEYIIEYTAEPDQQKDPRDAGSRLRGQRYSVEVVDQDTGKHHTIAVQATSVNAARSQAVEILSADLGIDKERLIPTKPEATPAN